MTLETVKHSIKNLLYKAHEKNWKNGGISIYDLADLQEASDRIITQDRADIRAVLREGVELKREPINTDTKEVNEANAIYNQALNDILTFIDTLLPGDVSK